MPGTTDKSTILVISVSLVMVLALFARGPIAQDPAYHVFADQRMLLGIPHFWNVLSNIPYLLAGIAGLGLVYNNNFPGGLPGLKLHYSLFFLGVCLVWAGSSWYHLSPSDEGLFWDRLSMTIVFMAFFAAIIGEYYSVPAGKRFLWPLLIAGLLSVVYWHITGKSGAGDLRPYAIVQFLPMLLIPLIVFFRPARLQPSGYLWWMMICYLLAKVMELHDREIYTISGVISGHTLKHLVSAAAVVFYYQALRKRRLSPGTFAYA